MCSLKKNKKSKIASTKLDVNNSEVVCPQQITEEWNQHFTNISSKLLQNLSCCATSFLKFVDKPLAYNYFCDKISTIEMIMQIYCLKRKNTSSPDFFNSKIFGDVVDQIVFPLEYIFKLLLKEGKFSVGLRTGKIIPIFKQGDQTIPSNCETNFTDIYFLKHIWKNYLCQIIKILEQKSIIVQISVWF